jgi:hypothetical protein
VPIARIDLKTELAGPELQPEEAHKMTRYPIKVVNPEQLPSELEGSISRLEGNYNFKPHIGLLANGELVMFVAHAEERITAPYRRLYVADR